MQDPAGFQETVPAAMPADFLAVQEEGFKLLPLSEVLLQGPSEVASPSDSLAVHVDTQVSQPWQSRGGCSFAGVHLRLLGRLKRFSQVAYML